LPFIINFVFDAAPFLQQRARGHHRGRKPEWFIGPLDRAGCRRSSYKFRWQDDQR
jgi:hypothetical protein